MKKTTRCSLVKKAGARLLCVALLLGMLPAYTGTVSAAETEISNAYTAPKLVLTRAQVDYDLKQDITFDAARYTLSVTDTGGFDSNVVGDYTVSYVLTPVAAASEAGTPLAPSSAALPGEVPKVPAASAESTIAFSRVVSVVENKNICITFMADPAGCNGKAVVFADGSAKLTVQIPAGGSIAANQLPVLKTADSGEAVAVTGWLHVASGMTYTAEQLAASALKQDESFTARTQQPQPQPPQQPQQPPQPPQPPAGQGLCTCGAGDLAENHAASCALLQQPANVATYAEKAGGTPAPRNARMMRSASGITVPKGMFYLAPNPAQDNRPGTYAWYDTFGAAVSAMNSNTTDYRLILCKAQQTLTAEDTGKGKALYQLGGADINSDADDKAKSLVISASWTDPAGADTLWNRDPATWSTATRLGLQGAPDDAGLITISTGTRTVNRTENVTVPGEIALGVPTTFRNIRFATGAMINAYSNTVVMGEGIENAPGTYFDLFGKTGNQSDTAFYQGGTLLEVFSGTYHQVCGGYYNAQQQSVENPRYVTGNKFVKLYGGNFVAENTPAIAVAANNDVRHRNYVVADSLDDLVDGGGAGKVAYSTVGTVSMLVQPMEGLLFVAPPAILLGIYSCSLYPNGKDTITLDTTYYKQPIDMSQTDIAAAPDGHLPAGVSGSSYAIEKLDANHTSVEMTINAPQTKIKSIWARCMDKTNLTTYPATIYINDIGAVTEYVSGSNRQPSVTLDDGVHKKDYSHDDATTLHINKTVQFNGVRWFSTVNIAPGVDLFTNNFEMVRSNLDAATSPEMQTEINDDKYIKSGFPALKLGYKSSLNVLKGGSNCTLGTVTCLEENTTTHQVESTLALTCDADAQWAAQCAMLFGRITPPAGVATGNLHIGITPGSAPLAAGMPYGALYVGRNTTAPDAFYTGKIPVGAITADSGSFMKKTTDGNMRLALTLTTPEPISLSSPSTAPVKCVDFNAVVTAMTAAKKPGEVFKITILKPYQLTVDDYDHLKLVNQSHCAGMIFTGWKEDFGFTLAGDGFQNEAETAEDLAERIGTADAGKNTPYKNVAPPSANSLTLLDAYDINPAVSITFRNLSLRSTGAGTRPIAYWTTAGGSLQIGPGLEQDTATYMNVYGGKLQGFTANDNYATSLTIFNGRYSAVLSDVMVGDQAQSNCGASRLSIYGGTFGAGPDDIDIIGTTMASGAGTTGTKEHGGGIGRTSTINLFLSKDYSFHLGGSPVIADAYGTAVNRGSSKITIENKDATLFEHFPVVAALHTTYTGADLLAGGSTIDLTAKNCTFGTVTPGNANASGALVSGGSGALALNVYAAASFEKIYGWGVPAHSVGTNPRGCEISFQDGCNTAVAAALSNWNTLTLLQGTQMPTKVQYHGAADTFYAANTAGPAVGQLLLHDNTELLLKNPQNNYGIGTLNGVDDDKNVNSNNNGTLLVNGQPNAHGLTVRGAFLGDPIHLGLAPEVLPQPNAKLLKLNAPGEALKADYQKHTSIASCVVKDNTDTPLANQGYVFITPKGRVRVYPAPQNGAPGANPMRYTDYITLYDALTDMEKYTAPTGEKFTVNFIADYTIGRHDVLGELSENISDNDDIAKLRDFAGIQSGAGEIKAIAFSSIHQKNPELLTEADMNGLFTVNVQRGKLYLPEKIPSLQNADPSIHDGIVFESFQFGADCTLIAANSCVTTMGAFGAAENGVGSVRMTTPSAMALCGGGADSSAPMASARLVVNNGSYGTILAGSQSSGAPVTGNATLDLNGGTGIDVSGTDTNGIATVNFNNVFTLRTITKFDEVNVNKNITVTGDFSCRAAAASPQYAGNLTLADAATLELQNEATSAAFGVGNLTAGTGATLLIPKAAGANTSSNPLQVAGEYKRTSTGTGALITDVKQKERRAPGDDLILFAAFSPAKSNFISSDTDAATLLLIEKSGKNPFTIEYGLPSKPDTRLVWVGVEKAETGAALEKTLYFDSMNYDAKAPEHDGTGAVTKLFVLTKAQLDTFLAAAEQSSLVGMADGNYTARIDRFDSTKQNAAHDGTGDGFHTHYYGHTTLSINPALSYYVLSYTAENRKEAWSYTKLDVNAPETVSTAPTATCLANGNREFTLALAEKQGESGLYRAAWSKARRLTGASGDTVAAPDYAAKYPADTFVPMPHSGAWTAGGTYDSGLQNIVTSLSGSAADYKVTVTLEQAIDMPTLYVYAQDALGNTREIVVTPDWKLTTDGVPVMKQISVRHAAALPTIAAPGVEKTVAFAFSAQPAAGSIDIGGTEVQSAFITKDASWTSASAEKIYAVALTKPAGAKPGEKTGVSAAAPFADAEQWYAYATTNGGKTVKIALDTQAPTYCAKGVTGGTISQKNETPEHVPASGTNATTDITVTLRLADPVRTPVTGTVYTPSGLSKAGWSATQLTAAQQTEICSSGFDSAAGKEWLTAFADGTDSAEIKLTARPNSEKIYLYTADQLGNMGETEIALIPTYHVSVPTWIGLVAVRGKTDRLIVPADGCYIINNSTMAVEAKITSFAAKGGAGNQLTLVTALSTSPVQNGQMRLMLKAKDSALPFGETAAASITNTTPLTLGTIPGCGNALTQHGAGFTFTANYNPDIPLRLSGWDLFTMSYQFTPKP